MQLAPEQGLRYRHLFQLNGLSRQVEQQLEKVDAVEQTRRQPIIVPVPAQPSTRRIARLNFFQSLQSRFGQNVIKARHS